MDPCGEHKSHLNRASVTAFHDMDERLDGVKETKQNNVHICLHECTALVILSNLLEISFICICESILEQCPLASASISYLLRTAKTLKIIFL